MSDIQDEAAAILAAIGGGAPPPAGGGAKKKKKKKGKKPAADATQQAVDAPDAPTPDAEKEEVSTAADSSEQSQSKKKKKKKADEPKAKPMNAMAKRAAEALARKKAEEEEIQRQKEAFEAEQARIEAEEAAKQKAEDEAREKRALKRKQQKERDRAAGKPMTKAEKARAEKQRRQREALVASGMVDASLFDQDGKSVASGSSAAVRKKAPKPAGPSAEELQAIKEAEEEEKRIAEEKAAAEAKAAEEAAAKAAEEAAAKAEAEAAEEAVAAVVDDWDASDDDWETALVEKVVAIKMEDEEIEEVVEPDYVVKRPEGGAKPAPSKKGKKGKKGKQTSAGNNDDSSDESSDDDDSDSDDDESAGASKRLQRKMELQAQKDAARQKREKRHKDALMNRSKDDLRSPICVVLGHVDTGKTKLLDRIRRTNVQEGEAGGITQQIGATYFPMENIRKATDKLNEDMHLEYRVPGLLVIDTPGHESFTNLRTRGSSLCDIAILVIDIMHGLEQQTIESIGLLRKRKTPFIVALNKVDRLYDWKPQNNSPIRASMAKQPDHVLSEFETRTKQVVTQLMEQGLNASLYYENKDFKKVVSLVPTSAHTGEGVPDLLLLLVQLTQDLMVEKLMFHSDLQCSVIEVKKIEGIGTTIDVVLVNGSLKDTDRIVVAGSNGPIVTQIRALLTPQPLKEMRVKGEYVHHKEIRAAMGIKIAANDLEHAIAGTSLYVVGPDDDEEELKDAVMEDVQMVMGSVSGKGVHVQASTLGSLEALMEFLKTSNIPVSHVSIGPVHKKDVSRASVMLAHKKEYATILAFDVKVTREAQELADSLEVKIFTAEIIYHLFDQFTAYLEQVKEERRQSSALEAVFPSVLRIIPEFIFMKKNPLVFGVEVVEGIVKVGTPMVVPDKMVPGDDGEPTMLYLGRIASIEKDSKSIDIAKRGSSVCVKIQPTAAESYVQLGRHFDENNLLYSRLTRASIDSLKENFKEDLDREDWKLVIRMKNVFGIV